MRVLDQVWRGDEQLSHHGVLGISSPVKREAVQEVRTMMGPETGQGDPLG